MVEIKTKDDKLKARIELESLIDDFGYGLKIYFVEGNHVAYLKLNKKELRQLHRDIGYLLAER